MIKKVLTTKIVEEEHEVFTFGELAMDVQETLIEHYRETNDLFDVVLLDEIIESFKAVAEHCNMHIDYCYDGYSNNTTLTTIDEIEGLSGVRAFAFVWNHYIEPNLSGKFLTYRNDKAYYSKCTKTWDCPFTGLCYDDVLYEAFNQFKDKFTLTSTVENFIDILENEMNKIVAKEAEYYSSDEYIIDELSRDNYYFANGELAEVV